MLFQFITSTSQYVLRQFTDKFSFNWTCLGNSESISSYKVLLFYWQGVSVNLTCSLFLLKRKFYLIFIPVRTILICFVSEKKYPLPKQLHDIQRRFRFEFGSDISQKNFVALFSIFLCFHELFSLVDDDNFFSFTKQSKGLLFMKSLSINMF